MKRYLWILALVISALFVGSVAADSSHAQQDQAFLQGLVQQAKAPMSPVLAEAPPVLAPVAFCGNHYCTWDPDCYVCPGGDGGTYCDRVEHLCYPY